MIVGKGASAEDRGGDEAAFLRRRRGLGIGIGERGEQILKDREGGELGLGEAGVESRDGVGVGGGGDHGAIIRSCDVRGVNGFLRWGREMAHKRGDARR